MVEFFYFVYFTVFEAVKLFAGTDYMIAELYVYAGKQSRERLSISFVVLGRQFVSARVRVRYYNFCRP